MRLGRELNATAVVTLGRGGGGGSMRLGWELKRAMNLEWAVSSAAIAAWAVRALGFSA